MPFDVDPQGKLLAAVRTDSELGLHSGVTLTPTIYVVTNSSKAPFVQVKDPDRELYHAIDQALAETASEKPQGKPAPTAHK
jgi:protein-disulfide isomerase